MKPRISILTPSYNQACYIEQTIQSVLDQDYADIEHIVIDGGSTDGTVEVLKQYPHVKWISERDRGQADALNKGLRMASGDIAGWINSDDFYERHIFRSVADVLGRPGTAWAIGNLSIEAAGETISCGRSPEPTYDALVQDPDIVRQPCTFFRREALERSGGWDPALQMVMDYDLWLRLARVARPRMVDANWAYFRTHPEQKTAKWAGLRQWREIDSVLRREHAPLRYRSRIAVRKHVSFGKAVAKTVLTRAGIFDPGRGAGQRSMAGTASR